MKRKLLIVLLLLVATFTYADIHSVMPSGAGSINDPYLLSTINELDWFFHLTQSETSGKYFTLTTDIDLNPTIVGTTYAPGIDRFEGHFNGDNHTISNYCIKAKDTYFTGLFNKLYKQATIKNLIIENPIISGETKTVDIGGLVGIMLDQTSLDNIYVINADIVGGRAVGGIVGESKSLANITNCMVINSTIRAEKALAGGICGVSHSTLNNMTCISNHIYTNMYGGGICGFIHMNTHALNLFNYQGSVEGNSNCGGILGRISKGLLENTFVGGTYIKGDENSTGVIIGTALNSIITHCSYDNTQEIKKHIGLSENNILQKLYSGNTSWCIEPKKITDWYDSNIELHTNEYPHLTSHSLRNTVALHTFLVYQKLAISPLILTQKDNNYASIKQDVVGGGSDLSIHWKSSNKSILEFKYNRGIIKRNGVIAVNANLETKTLTYLLNIVAKPRVKVFIKPDNMHIIATNYDRERRLNDTLYLEQGDTAYIGISGIKDHSFNENMYQITGYSYNDKSELSFAKNLLHQTKSAEFIIPDTSLYISTQIVIPNSEGRKIPSIVENIKFNDQSNIIETPYPIQVNNSITLCKTFDPNKWYTIAFPFEINRITVTEDDGSEYNLQPCLSVNDANGNFYLKNLGPAPSSSEFKKSWIWANKVIKNKPYIIAFPHEYYKDKTITFYGPKQTINDTSNKFIASQNSPGDHYKFLANTSFEIQNIIEPYELNRDGKYFIKKTNQITLYPFSSYVNSMSDVTTKISLQALLEKKEDTIINNTSTSNLKYYVLKNTLFLESPINETIKIMSINGIVLKEIVIKAHDIQTIKDLPQGLILLQELSNHNLRKIII